MEEKTYDENELENKSCNEIIKELSTDQENGLTNKEARKRIKTYGKNVIREEERNPILDFFSHFWGPIPWMLEIACILAAIAQRWEDFSVIFVMLLINGGVSYWHESKAESAIQALKEKLAPTARVIRQGNRNEISSKKLVPGDVVILRMGDVVPADLMLLPEQNLSIDESALTGESIPADKNENDLCYSGTSVKRGEARGIVVNTGRNTRFARTVELVAEAREKSHFQKAVLKIGKFLIGITFVLVVIIVVTGILRNDPLFEVLMFALVVTIAGIPQALPAVLSVTMTIGARRLARHKAIVSKLSAMEEMAGLEVLCADKTGTLTLNNKSDLDNFKVKEFRPFDPTRKRAEADVEKDGTFTVAKGAPQVISDLVDADDQQQKEISEKVNELGEQGYRALGVARKTNGGWQYLGILPMLDPPREGSDEVLDDARKHGIDVRMVTGDHSAIAKQVAGQVGLGSHVVEASQLFEEEKKGEETQQKIDEEVIYADAFAEVTPEHKFNIIKHFQRKNKIVGMTGDGVNDAPALKQADVGIAVAGATDAARSAAALVLTAPGLDVITRAVEESYATFRITESMRVLLFMTLSILIFNFYPVTAIMVVLLAILNDIPIMMIAYDNVKTARKPVRWNMPRVLTTASILSVGGVISSFLLFWYIDTRLGYDDATIRTMIFLKLLIAGHMTIFLTRTSGWLWQKPYPNIWFFIALEGTQIIGTLFGVYGWIIPPIGWAKALAVWGYAIVWLLILNVILMMVQPIMDMKNLGQKRAKESVRRNN